MLIHKEREWQIRLMDVGYEQEDIPKVAVFIWSLQW